MGKSHANNKSDWNSYQKLQGQKRKAVEKTADAAVAVADVLCEPVKEKPKGTALDIRRRRTGRHLWDREPINGYSQKHSDVARHVVGLKFSNYPQREAFKSAAEHYGLSKVTVERLYYDKPTLFDLAEKELVENAITEYHQNLWVSRTALSQAGPLAVETLCSILEDEFASPSVKSKSAVAILKMLDIDGSNNANPSERVALESLKLVRSVTDKIKEKGESHVIEATEVEIIEEDASEVRTDSEL
ncbi:MAG: hypothetical protein ACW99X_18225 [Candidatus Thorarchaeota archaeon]